MKMMLSSRLSAAAAAIVAILLISACQDGDENGAPATSPTVTVSQRLSPSTSPPLSPAPSESIPPGGPDAAFDSFREFASRVQAAIQSQDTNFFIDNAVFTSLDCPNELQGDCGFPYPTTIEGIRVGVWQSEGTVQAPDEFEGTLSDYLATNPRLHSLAALNRDIGGAIGGTPYYAILNSPAAPSGTTIALGFTNDGGAWRFYLYLNAGTTETSTNEWLSGTCAECYDYWEPWEGS
jgi:hypothetical protein